MARIKPAYEIDEAELESLAPSERLDAQIQSLYAHRPKLRDAFFGLVAALNTTGTLPTRLTELVRLRIAFWNQCRSCMSMRYDPNAISEDLVCSLERPEESPDLSDAEKAALRYADLLATNHLAIDAAVYEGLREHFSEGEIVELGIHCAEYVGYGRLAASWGLHEHLHESYRVQKEQYTPWGEGALI